MMASWKDSPAGHTPGRVVEKTNHIIFAWWDMTLYAGTSGVGLLLADTGQHFAYLAIPEHCVARISWTKDHGCDACVYWHAIQQWDLVVIEWLDAKQEADIEATYADCWAEVRGDVVGPPEPDDDEGQFPDDDDDWPIMPWGDF